MNEFDLSKQFNITSPSNLLAGDKILVIEDQNDLRLILAHQLNKITYDNVVQAANGYYAFEMMREHKDIAAIICDEKMPVLNGLDLLNEIRETPEIARPPFCLTMEDVSREKVMFAIENGVDEILAKPFTLADIGPRLHSSFKKFHNPRNPEKAYELAKKFLTDKKFEDAAKVYQALSETSPNSARPLVGLARVAIKRGDATLALTHLTSAQQRNPNYVHSYVVRAELLVQLKKFSEAVNCYEKAIQLSPLNPIRYKAAANILFQEQRFTDAVRILEVALTHHLDFPDLHHFLSQAYFSLKDYQKASRHVRSALNADPENVTYLNQLGVCLKETKQFEESEKTYNQIIKLDPDNVAALYNKAILLQVRGDLDDAIKNLERALKKSPDFEVARKKLAEFKALGPKKAS